METTIAVTIFIVSFFVLMSVLVVDRNPKYGSRLMAIDIGLVVPAACGVVGSLMWLLW